LGGDIGVSFAFHVLIYSNFQRLLEVPASGAEKGETSPSMMNVTELFIGSENSKAECVPPVLAALRQNIRPAPATI
jgi:hypothetical protein